MNTERHLGTVIWFNDKRGYGYLQVDPSLNEGKDLFVHHSNINMEGFRSLRPEQKVSFVLGANDNGPQAEQIEVIDETTKQQ